MSPGIHASESTHWDISQEDSWEVGGGQEEGEEVEEEGWWEKKRRKRRYE